MIKKWNNSFNETFIYLLLFSLTLLFLDFDNFYFLKPRSFHFIRQTDTLSFVDYYVFTGINFFDTGNLNLYNETGKSVCEFPILYYITAFFVKIGFESYKTLRIIHLIIFCTSSIIIFNFLKKQFNFLNSLSIIFLLFSSTIILYYSINYIPNFPALCFTLCGIVYFFKYLEQSLKGILLLSISFFLIASLLKITFAIYPTTCFLIFCYKKIKDKSFFSIELFLFLILFCLLLTWNLFVVDYNKYNNADYYLTSIKPIWSINDNSIKEVFNFILNYWIYKYYFPSAIHLFFIILFVSLFYFKKIPFDRFAFIIISLIGVSCYFILFFTQFRDHDYYFMEFVPFLFIIFITSYKAILDSVNRKIALITSFIILTITCLSLNYAKLNLRRRYDKPFEQVSYIAKELENIKYKVDSLNISKEDKILVVPDKTMNGSLYYLNRFGYTVGDTLSENLNKYYNKSNYILVTDSSILNGVKKKFGLKQPVLIYRGTVLFKIINNQ